MPIDVVITKESKLDLLTDIMPITRRLVNTKALKSAHPLGEARKLGSTIKHILSRGSLCIVRAISIINGGKKESEEKYHPENGTPPILARIVKTRTNV